MAPHLWPRRESPPRSPASRPDFGIILAWTVEDKSNEGMCAYVTRTAPKSFRGKRLPKRLGRIDGIHEFPENLIGDVALLHRGGDYTCKVFAVDKKVYLGTYKFSLPWEPLIDGLEIEPKEER